MKAGSLIDRTDFDLNAERWFGISPLSVSKVEVLKESLEGKDIVITCTSIVSIQEIPIPMIFDCRATGITSTDQDLAPHPQLPLQQVKAEWEVNVINGMFNEAGDIAQHAKHGLTVQNDRKWMPMYITMFSHDRIVLGIPGLHLHDVAVRFAPNSITLG